MTVSLLAGTKSSCVLTESGSEGDGPGLAPPTATAGAPRAATQTGAETMIMRIYRGTSRFRRRWAPGTSSLVARAALLGLAFLLGLVAA